MSLTVAFAALCTGIVVWWLLVRQLTAKSWQHGSAGDAGVASGEKLLQTEPSARVGLWVFLGVVTSLFSLFIAAYFIRMGKGHGAAQTMNDWRAVTDPPILWFNTFVLIIGSAVMQAARQAVTRQQTLRTRRCLIAGGLLTMVFLAGQLTAWQQMGATGYALRSNPAVAFFYVLTAVHALHLLGGLVVWGRTLRRIWTDGVELIEVSLSVELCSVYWHYLLLVWLVLFALLLYT